MRSASRWLPILTIAVLLLGASCHHSSESQAGTVTDAPPSETPAIRIVARTPSDDNRTRGASRSFVSTDRIVLEADLAETLWKLDDGSSDGTLDPSSHNGPRFEIITLRPKPIAGSRSRPLKYTLRASSGDRQSTFVLEQDPIDTIRQQYLDLKKKRMPSREEFLSGGRSKRGFFQFKEIQSRDGAPWAVFTSLDHLDEWRENYGGPLKVNRGFSTPRHNAKIKGAARNSQHLYGTAADIDSDASDWHAKRDAAREAGACLEPLAISGYGHVHGDWREQCPAGW
jgi:hypothetical protein